MGWETCNCYTLAFVFLTAAIFEMEMGERGWPIVAGNTSLGDRMGSWDVSSLPQMTLDGLGLK